MSTGAIIAIVAAVLILLLLVLVVMPRARAGRRERELEERRRRTAEKHREEAATLQARADFAESQARKERAEAEMLEAKARMHEAGQADDELIGDRRRDADRDRVRDERDADRDPDKAATVPPPAAHDGSDQPPVHREPAVRGGAAAVDERDYEQGREDERRIQEGEDSPQAPPPRA